MLTNLETLDASLDEISPPRLKPYQPAPDQQTTLSRMQQLYLPLRRVLDFGLTVAVALIALPLVLLAALAVKITSRGPAFYTQIRTGKGGKPFTIYKIRTMLDKCESLTGPRWTIPGDPRVTPIGWLLRRTHIDELPQLLNVLLGDMSLIGPRPERPEFVSELAQELPDYHERHAVLPGITGLAQVQLAPDTDLESVRRKLQYDLHFVEGLGLWLDLRILVATFLHLFGMSFALLSRLHIVPGPAQVETPENLPFPSADVEMRQRAA